MMRLLTLPVIILVLLSSAVSAPVQARNAEVPNSGPVEKIAANLVPLISAGSPNQKISIIVTFRNQSALDLAEHAGKPANRKNVVNTLRTNSQLSQANIRKLIDQRQKGGKVDRVVSFWIFNGISLSATPDVIQELANQPEVLSIREDSKISAPIVNTIPAPQDEQNTLIPVTGMDAATLAQPNLSLLHIPDLWANGYHGQGVVVANVDTGVDGTHPDLAAQYRGGANSWFDPYQQHATPTDLNGHGTWTMGVMVGRNASGSWVGVAPEAKWIAARIFDDQNSATLTAIHQAYQWLLDPDGNPATDDAPDVVNSSWGFQSPGCDLSFEADIQALRAAGILPIFSAGNSGPGPGTGTSPSNNPGAVSVGATDRNDAIYFGSSRGTTTCGESERLFPTITAPGVSIFSTGLSHSYSYATGTSLAAPHAAGTLALLLSARPGLSVSEQENLLDGGVVDLGAAGPDNDFGLGRIDSYRSYQGLEIVNTSFPKLYLPMITR